MNSGCFIYLSQLIKNWESKKVRAYLSLSSPQDCYNLLCEKNERGKNLLELAEEVRDFSSVFSLLHVAVCSIKCLQQQVDRIDSFCSKNPPFERYKDWLIELLDAVEKNSPDLLDATKKRFLNGKPDPNWVSGVKRTYWSGEPQNDPAEGGEKGKSEPLTILRFIQKDLKVESLEQDALLLDFQKMRLH